jgi:membrane protein YqaA with SNARE-associated domain
MLKKQAEYSPWPVAVQAGQAACMARLARWPKRPSSRPTQSCHTLVQFPAVPCSPVQCRPIPNPPPHPSRAVEAFIDLLLQTLAVPKFSLGAVFVVSFISATLLPLGSEPVVFGLIKLNADLFWPVILTATAGNTLGGALDWWMGYGAHQAVDKYRGSGTHIKAIAWMGRFGPRACLLSWLPLIGDPLCAVAGWLKMPFWPCLAYMAVGKFMRYWVMTSLLLLAFPG